MKPLKKKNINLYVLIVFILFSCTTKNTKQINIDNEQYLTSDTVEMSNGDDYELQIEEIDINNSSLNNTLENPAKETVAVIFGPGLYRTFRSINFLKSLQESKPIHVGMFCGIEFGAIVAYMAAEGWRPEKMEWFLFGLSKLLKNTAPFSSNWKSILRNYLNKNLITANSKSNLCFTYHNGEKNTEDIQFGKGEADQFFQALGISESRKIKASKRIEDGLIENLYRKEFKDVIFVDTINSVIDFKYNIDRSFYSGFYGRYKSDGLRLKKSVKLYIDLSEGQSSIDEFPDFLGDLNKSLFNKSKKYLSDFMVNDLSSGDENE